jgi:hypothetical protein
MIDDSLCNFFGVLIGGLCGIVIALAIVYVSDR